MIGDLRRGNLARDVASRAHQMRSHRFDVGRGHLSTVQSIGPARFHPVRRSRSALKITSRETPMSAAIAAHREA